MNTAAVDWEVWNRVSQLLMDMAPSQLRWDVEPTFQSTPVSHLMGQLSLASNTVKDICLSVECNLENVTLWADYIGGNNNESVPMSDPDMVSKFQVAALRLMRKSYQSALQEAEDRMADAQQDIDGYNACLEDLDG